MLESAVGDGLEELGPEQEVAESAAVDADVRTLGVLALSGGVTFLRIAVGGSTSGGGVSGLKLLVGVINEILLGGHDGGVLEVMCGLSRKAAASRKVAGYSWAAVMAVARWSV